MEIINASACSKVYDKLEGLPFGDFVSDDANQLH